MFFDLWALLPGDPWERVLEIAIRRSRTFVVLFDQHLGRSQAKEIDTMVARAESGEARLIPVVFSGLDRLPPGVHQFREIRAPRLVLDANSALINALGRGGAPHDIDINALAEMLAPIALGR